MGGILGGILRWELGGTGGSQWVNSIECDIDRNPGGMYGIWDPW